MNFTVRVAIYAVCFCTAGAAQDQRILTPHGLGPVSTGMTLAEAQTALGTKLEHLNLMEGCNYAVQNGDPGVGIFYDIEGDRIVAIEIEPARNTSREPSISTAAGIRLGSPVADVRKGYGALLRTQKPSIRRSWIVNELVVDGPEPGRGIVFEMDGEKVVGMRAGLYPKLRSASDCD